MQQAAETAKTVYEHARAAMIAAEVLIECLLYYYIVLQLMYHCVTDA